MLDKCKSLRRKGNDGNMYKSVPNKRGVYRWIKESLNVNKISLKVLKIWSTDIMLLQKEQKNK